ncbi:MAG: MerC domain-containing protein [Pirellulales bacterium]
MKSQQLSIVPVESNTLRQAWTDWAGVMASIGCAIHCALMPLAIAYLPALGLSWMADSTFHRWMAGACFLLAIAAFGPGWKCHRRMTPAVIGSLGVAFLVGGSFLVEEVCCSRCAELPSKPGGEAAAAASGEDFDCCEPVESSWTAWMLTPLGGALLVAGHVANHQCRCRICRSRQS